MLTLCRVTSSYRNSSTRTLGELPAYAESALSESQVRPLTLSSGKPPSAGPAPLHAVSSQTPGTRGRASYSPVAQNPVRPGRGEPPLRFWQSKVCADPKKPPRPRETRRESPRPAPPPTTGLVTSEAQQANGRCALERSACCAA